MSQANTVANRHKSVEDTYQKLSQLEHILLRPDTYIGSTERTTAPLWVLATDVTDDGRPRERMVLREVTYVPGLYKIFDEILVNAADHKQRDPGMDTIRVDIEPENNRISVYNNGSGIPVEVHAKERCYVAELIFGHLLTSSNYDDEERKVTGGRNGYGAKLANIFSTEFVVETADGRHRYRQCFRRNMQEKGEPCISSCSAKDNFTRITFTPDLAKFGMSHLDADTVSLMQKRVYDVAGANPTLRVVLNGQRLPIRSFKQYVELYLADKPDAVRLHERVNDRWEVVVSGSDGQFSQVSFVNSIWTIKGGTHVNHVADQLVGAIVEAVGKKHKSVKLKPFQVRNHLWVFVNCLIENPSFDSQTKENLTSKPSTFGSRCGLSAELLRRVARSDIVGSVLDYAKYKQSAELKKTDGGKKQRVSGIPKLDDANMAGSREAHKCTLILTEGDSAKALAISGLSVIGRDYYGVFPLRGKLLNVREATHKQIMENAEINHLKKILGLQHGKAYDATSVKSLRYGHVMIMTDQDHDGSHIKGLLINFFHHFWPSLLQQVPGFLLEFITPIVKATRSKGGGRAEEVVFFTIPEYQAWRARQPSLRGVTIKYYKGLGTSTAAEAKAYFSNLPRHQHAFVWSGRDDGESIELAFSKLRVNERKQWLAAHQLGTYFDHEADTLTYHNFVHKELVLFSLADNARSIPCVVDGLKPSQRKVLFACFKRRLQREIKVAQLAGYVGEHAAYHHGEASLMATVVGLAQNFVGSNNVNLLVPAGQFGTRLQGGKDAASARYIFTRLAPVTRALFPEADDVLLEYLEEDGLGIEPRWYCPVLPMVLVNGAEGIGTGWSTSVPCFNPHDLIQALRQMLQADEPGTVATDLRPWYRGYQGRVLPQRHAPGNYEVHGTVYRVDAQTVQVRELPLRTWTQPYKEWLETCLVGAEASATAASSGTSSSGRTAANAAFLRELADNSTETRVQFTLTFRDAATLQAAVESSGGGLHKRLRLSGSLSTGNMVLFDHQGKICRYESAADILREFYGVRLRLYCERKRHLVAALERDVLRLENKVRFILAVVHGEIRVANRKRDELLRELEAKGFAKICSQRGTAGDGKEPEEEAEEEVACQAPDASGYDYLLSMPLWSLTRERVEELRRQRDGKVGELEVTRATTPKELWLRDLEQVERALAEGAAELEAGEKRASGNGGARARSSPTAATADVTLEEIPPPPPSERPPRSQRSSVASSADTDGTESTSLRSGDIEENNTSATTRAARRKTSRAAPCQRAPPAAEAAMSELSLSERLAQRLQLQPTSSTSEATTSASQSHSRKLFSASDYLASLKSRLGQEPPPPPPAAAAATDTETADERSASAASCAPTAGPAPARSRRLRRVVSYSVDEEEDDDDDDDDDGEDTSFQLDASTTIISDDDDDA